MNLNSRARLARPKAFYFLLAVMLGVSAPAAMAKSETQPASSKQSSSTHSKKNGSTSKSSSTKAGSSTKTAATRSSDSKKLVASASSDLSDCSWHETRLKPGQTLSAALAGQHFSGSNGTQLEGQISSQAVKRLHAGDAVKFCVARSKHSEQLLALQIPGAPSASLHRDRPSAHEIVSNKPITETGVPQLPTLESAQILALGDHSSSLDLPIAGSGSLGDSLTTAGIEPSLVQPLRAWMEKNPSVTDGIPTGSRINVLLADDASHSGLGLMRLTLATPGDTHEMFGYSTADGRSWLLQPNGVGVLHLPMIVPVEAKRISSGWGWREHPVMHTQEFHKGVDFEAPMGTPVRAAAAGTIEFAGWHGNYGRLLVVRHAEGAATRYGHLSGFAPSVRAGETVAAGDVIGYVGRSGLATGPHLYFELYLGDEPVNPLKDHVDVPVALDGSELVRFEQFMHGVDRLSIASAS